MRSLASFTSCGRKTLKVKKLALTTTKRQNCVVGEVPTSVRPVRVYLRMAEVNVGAGPSGLSIHTVVSVTVDFAGNGHSTNGSNNNTTPIRSRKRPRRPETWKKNMAKSKRAKGEEYVSPSTGKTVPARTLGEPCKCKNQCYDLFTQEEKSSLLESFNRLANKELQDSHLFGLIKSKPVQRRRPRTGQGTKQRKATYTYQVNNFTIHYLWFGNNLV